MKYTLAAAFALAASSFANAQAVTSVITPSAAAPSGCATTFSGNFEINVMNVTTSMKKRSPFEKRATVCGGTGTLVINLCNGVLHDALGRTGYIASNRQFQFDEPPQAGAIYTAGFSVCSNGSLALGGSAVFQQCLSGSFYNLYDQSTGAQCSPVYIDTIACSNGTTPVCGAAASPTGSSAVVVSSMTSSSTMVSNMTMTTASTMAITTSMTMSTMTETPSVASSAVVSESTDGQPQATTATASIAVQTTNAGSALSAGKEFAALAAGVAALVMI